MKKGENHLKLVKLNSLQLLRGIAALLVLLTHETTIVKEAFNENYFSGYFNMGNCGVDIFFVLSGFIIFYSNHHLIDDPSGFVSFIKKRIFRVYPLYWLISLGLIMFHIIYPSAGAGDELKFDIVFRSLLLIPNYRPPILTVGWSLIHEILFYFIFSLTIILKPTFSKILVASWSFAIFLVLFFSFYTVPSNIKDPLLIVLTYPQNIEFIFGCIAAISIKTNQIRITSKRFLGFIRLNVFFCSLIILLTGFTQYYGIDIFNNRTGIHVLIYGIIATILILSLVLLDIWNMNVRALGISNHNSMAIIGVIRHYVISSMTFLGDASYSIYLTHIPSLLIFVELIKYLKIHDFIGGFWASNILFICVVISGIFTHLCIELPTLKFFKSRFAN
jgi:peptidoglycan/LPS O-acetylase OafA/YrhL